MSTAQRIPVPDRINTKEIINLTARLAQILAEEVDLLGAMKVSKIEALQQEKIFLTNALEAHRKMIDKYPHLSETIPSQDRSDLESIASVFDDILAENHRRLLMAKSVNEQMMGAVAEVVRDAARSRIYGESGEAGLMPHEVISVTLNKII